ncbi:MAG: class I SAM-dependent methyltransferase [Acidimicrobiales bacterium]
MPDDEGLCLAAAATDLVATAVAPPLLVEIGAYCGRSTLYLAAGIAAGLALTDGLVGGDNSRRATLFSVDHHHGSEENQPGWEHHDPNLIDARTGRMDTLAHWRTSIDDADAADLVVGVVGSSPVVATHWKSPIGLLFIDGGHGQEPAWADYLGWVPHVAATAFLAIHDVFPDPSEGGRPPYELYSRAIASGGFCEEPGLSKGSLRVLKRIGDAF